MAYRTFQVAPKVLVASDARSVASWGFFGGSILSDARPDFTQACRKHTKH